MSNKTEILKIRGVEITLENHELGQGRITIKGSNLFSMFWGSMGGTIQEFLCKINSDYFASKLQGSERSETFNVKQTFKELRRFIREDLDLQWYKHLEFQKDLREKLRGFEVECREYPYDRFFVDNFHFNFCINPDFYLINNKWECERIEKEFKNITEPWHFIQTSESENTKYLKSLHKQIVRKLSKLEVVLA